MTDYKISLILPTINRYTELDVFFESLSLQTYKNFEVIVVDQNEYNTVQNIVDKYKACFVIKYYHSSLKGLSLNRNVGLKKVSGEIITFADDDCEYKCDTLKFVNDFFNNNNYFFFTFNTEDKETQRHGFPSEARRIVNYKNFFISGCSFTIFVKKSAITNFIFDEQLGVGAKYGSGEESDMIIYLLSQGFIGIYDGEYTIYHPYKGKKFDYNRAYNYGLGYGALFKKILVVYRKYFLLTLYIWAIIKNIGAIFFTNKRKYYLYAFVGKILGFILYKK